MRRLCILPLLLLAGLELAVSASILDSSSAKERLRVVIETDAGGDPDDEQSLVRFLLYANEWDVEAIIANRPIARDRENVNPERTGLSIVRRLLEAYGQCWTNLVRNNPRYPTKDYLWDRTVPGYNDTTEAVERIIRIVDASDQRPVWYSDWGTDHGSATNNLRRALDRVLRERGSAGYARFKSKLRLCSADKFAEHTAVIPPTFAIWVDTLRPELDGKRWYHRFSAITAHAGGFEVARDVLTGHGVLGALYPTNTIPPQKEGDSMMFIYLIPTGMNDPEHPGWGSWAGRYGLNETMPDAPYYWANQVDEWRGTTNRDNTLARWAVALQNDFRARLDWCVKPFDQANHPPVTKLKSSVAGPVSPGEVVKIDASGCSDPDGQPLTFEWQIYPPSGDLPGTLIRGQGTPKAQLLMPSVKHPTELHVLLTLTDSGSPALTRYGRVVLQVDPRK